MTEDATRISGPPGPTRAMVLAAGRGERMRPITDHTPKPLVAVGGRTLLDRILDHLLVSGVREAVVNIHHLAERIERHLARRHQPAIRLSKESTLLETGGGVARALPLLGTAPFFAINGDVLWRDGAEPTLVTLAHGWQGDRMDVLLLLHSVDDAIGYHGGGDFGIDASGRLHRRGARPSAPYLFAGLQILHPRAFVDIPHGQPFSLNRIYDRALEAGRLFGVIHGGGWCHVGTPEDIPLAEAFLRGEMEPDG